jgi:hypothetical protein
MTKARAWKGVNQECNPKAVFTLLGMWESVREWAHTLPSGFPLWELEFSWNPEFLNIHLKGQNSLDWRYPYTTGNFLRLKCLKWTHIIYLNIYNTSYGQKKGQRSNCQFDFRPLKVGNRPKLCVCRWCATYHWKTLDKGYKLFWTSS